MMLPEVQLQQIRPFVMVIYLQELPVRLMEVEAAQLYTSGRIVRIMSPLLILPEQLYQAIVQGYW